MSTQNLHKDVNNRITHNDQNLKVTKKFSVTENIGSKILFKAKVKYDPSHEKIDKRFKYISLRLTIWKIFLFHDALWLSLKDRRFVSIWFGSVDTKRCNSENLGGRNIILMILYWWILSFYNCPHTDTMGPHPTEFKRKLQTIGGCDVMRQINVVTTLVRLLMMRQGLPIGMEDTAEITELSAVPKI